MDVHKLLPAQNWPRAIEGAIESARFLHSLFVGGLGEQEGRVSGRDSKRPRLRARGAAGREFHRSVRVNSCRVPRAIQREYQYIDLFADWNEACEDRWR
jgi:hypothetical protein